MAQKKRAKRIVGWKEHVALPDLKVKSVIAKIDTGASVASIDASEIKVVKKEGIKYIVTTGPPHSSHLIGLKLKKEFFFLV